MTNGVFDPSKWNEFIDYLAANVNQPAKIESVRDALKGVPQDKLTEVQQLLAQYNSLVVSIEDYNNRLAKTGGNAVVAQQLYEMETMRRRILDQLRTFPDRIVDQP